MFSIIHFAAVKGLSGLSAEMAGFEVLYVDRTQSTGIKGGVRIN
jgi:hypothetical protein